MPTPRRMPSVWEVIQNPSLMLGLPSAVAEVIAEQIQKVEQQVLGAKSVPPTPIDMAISYPRYRWMDTPHIHYLGDAVALAVDSHGAIIVTMPPRHAKTHTCSVWTPFWYLAQYPENQVLFISYSYQFARKWGMKVRQLIELYGADYGLFIDPKHTAADDWQLITGGGMKSVGRGGGIAGNPAKLLIGDDLLKDQEEGDSEIVRENTWDWIESTVMQRVEPDTVVIFIGTRYHEDDYIGRLISGSRSGEGMKFEEIELRAKAEADDPLGRQSGEGLWTNHPLPDGSTWGQAFYDKKEHDLSAHRWQSIYQQRPSPPGGNLVDPDWWRFYRPNELPDKFDQWGESWDLALDAIKKADSYHCGGVGARKEALVYIRDCYHEHGQINASPDSRERTVVTTIRNWRQIYPGPRQRLIERAIAGPMLVQTLRHEVGGLIEWPPKGQRKASKEANVNACVPDIRSGNVLLPVNHDGTKPKWVQELIEEFRAFPRGPHDDYVDMTTQLLMFLLPSARRSATDALADAKAMQPVKSAEDHHRQVLHSFMKRLAERNTRRIKRQLDRGQPAVLPFQRAGSGRGSGRLRGMW